MNNVDHTVIEEGREFAFNSYKTVSMSDHKENVERLIYQFEKATQKSYFANFGFNKLIILISKWEPLRAGGSHIPTPELIQNRGGVVSIQN